MIYATHSARIIAPISFAKGNGKTGTIPIGPCLIEQVDHHSFDVVWGARGQSSAALRAEDIKAATDVGNLVLLD
jgi:hypothetical protein